MNKLAELDKEIAQLELDCRAKAMSRIGHMTDPLLKAELARVKAALVDCKSMRLELKRSFDKAANDERTAAYKAEKAQEAADLLAKGKRLSRLDEALETLIHKYFELQSGSYCLSHVFREAERVRSRHINMVNAAKKARGLKL